MGHKMMKETGMKVEHLRERTTCVRSWSEPRVHEIIKAVAQEFHVTPEQITGRSKTEIVSHARQAVYLLATIMTGHSVQAIAAFIGDRDHSSILWGIVSMHKRRQECPDLDQRLASARAVSFELAAKRVAATRFSPEEVESMTSKNPKRWPREKRREWQEWINGQASLA